jgi:hypothetical protein
MRILVTALVAALATSASPLASTTPASVPTADLTARRAVPSAQIGYHVWDWAEGQYYCLTHPGDPYCDGSYNAQNVPPEWYSTAEVSTYTTFRLEDGTPVEGEYTSVSATEVIGGSFQDDGHLEDAVVGGLSGVASAAAMTLAMGYRQVVAEAVWAVGVDAAIAIGVGGALPWVAGAVVGIGVAW